MSCQAVRTALSGPGCQDQPGSNHKPYVSELCIGYTGYEYYYIYTVLDTGFDQALFMYIPDYIYSILALQAYCTLRNTGTAKLAQVIGFRCVWQCWGLVLQTASRVQ